MSSSEIETDEQNVDHHTPLISSPKFKSSPRQASDESDSSEGEKANEKTPVTDERSPTSKGRPLKSGLRTSTKGKSKYEDDNEDSSDEKTKAKHKKSKNAKAKGKSKQDDEEEHDDDSSEDDKELSPIDRIHKLRTKTEQTMITQHSREPVTVYVGGQQQRIGKVVTEQRLMFRSKQKPFFVSLKHLTYAVKVTTAKAFQTTFFNNLPPVELVNKYILRRNQTRPWPILKDLNIYFKPGTLTLVLGPPGSGKSSLLQMLATRLGTSDQNITGEMLFNGVPPSPKHHHRDVAFLGQSDEIHIPQLTVRETFRFAVYCQMPHGVPAYIKEQRVDVMLQLMGLAHRADTIVGDELLRGVSGGEKRRVSLGVECLTKMPSFFALDEPTTGLDAAAALDLVRFFKTMTASTGAPIVMALLQPSYEIFCLFDKIVLLSQGEVAYFGDRVEALKFYEDRGYICDLVTNPAEFLQEVIENPEKYKRSQKEVEKDADLAEKNIKEAAEEERRKDKEDKKGSKNSKRDEESDGTETDDKKDDKNKKDKKDKKDKKKDGEKKKNGIGKKHKTDKGVESDGTDSDADNDKKNDGEKEYTRERFIKDWREENLKDIIHTINVENARILEEEPEKDEEDPEKGQPAKPKKTDQILAATHLDKFSPEKRREKKEIDEKRKKTQWYGDEYEYPASWLTQFIFLLQRSWFTLVRDKDVFQVRLFRSSIMAIVFGTLFLKLSHNQTDGVRTKPSYIYFMETFIAFGSLAYLPAFFKEKRVYFYQRGARYYRVLPYYLASIIVDIPVQLLEVILFGTITYFLAGLDHNAGKYFFWIFLLLVLQNQMKTLMKLCGIIFQSPANASSAAALMVFFLVLFSGFSVPRQKIGNWFIWIYWISPFQWAWQAAMINEYAGETSYYCNEDELFPLRDTIYYNQPYPKGTGGSQICQFTSGDQILAQRYQFWTDLNRRWICLGISIAYAVIWHVISYFCLVMLNPKQPRRKMGGFGINPQKKAMAQAGHQKAGGANESQAGGGAEHAEDGTGNLPDDYDEYMSKDGQHDEYQEANDRETRDGMESDEEGDSKGKNKDNKKGKKPGVNGMQGKQKGHAAMKSSLGRQMEQKGLKKSARNPVGVDPNFDKEKSRAGYLVFTDLSYSVKAGGENPVARSLNWVKSTIMSLLNRFRGTKKDEKGPSDNDNDKDKDKDKEGDSESEEDKKKRSSDDEGVSNGKKNGEENGKKGKKSDKKKDNKTKDIKGSITLLYDINGYVAPGQMLALMGASGAGKTTLLDVLGLRKTAGKIKGHMELNGKSMSKRTNRHIGYVEQRDIHILTATVEEAITFSAMLRLPSKSMFSRNKKDKQTTNQNGNKDDLEKGKQDSDDETDSDETDSDEETSDDDSKNGTEMKERNKDKKKQPSTKQDNKESVKIQKRSKKEKLQLVEDLLDILELQPLRKRLVVMLSPEQKKRLTIGVEMAADPVVLFLDEPTSGLDSRGAEIVMRVVRQIVDSGRASVICTIHQPSSTVFSLFTHLLLLKKGGRQIYFGPIHSECKKDKKAGGLGGKFGGVLNYFGELGLKCEPHRNPADWVLDVSGAGIGRDQMVTEEQKAKKWQIVKKLKWNYRQKKYKKGNEKTQKLREELGIEPPTMENNKGDIDDPKILKKNLAAVSYMDDDKDDHQNNNASEAEEEEDNNEEHNPDFDSDHDQNEIVKKQERNAKKGKSNKNTKDAHKDAQDPEFSLQMQEREKRNKKKTEKMDLVSAFENSKRYEEMMDFIEEHKPSGQQESKFKRFIMKAKNSYAVGFFPQFWYSLKRSLITTWRDPTATRTRILRALFLGLIIGFLYYDLNRGATDMTLRIGLIFFMIIFTLLNSIPSVPKIMLERSVFYRERASMTYRSLVYLGVLILEDFPFMLLSVITFIIPIYFLGNLQYSAGKFFFFVLAFLLVYLCSFGWVQLVSILSPSMGSANALLGITLPIVLVFCGFLRSRTEIPRYWIWAHYLSFFTYIVESVNINELKLQPVYCEWGELIPVPVNVNGTMQVARVCPYHTGTDILDMFDLESNMKWPDIAILFGFYIVFVLGAWFGLKFVKNIKR